MANTNRDLFMTFNVKKSTVTGGGFSFYITDKNTSNFFVQLITDVETNSFITKYVTLEKASDYRLVLQVVKPNRELIEIEGQLMDEKNAIYQFNLKDEEKDMIGTYNCEFWVCSMVNKEEEITTSNPWTYNVISSILSKADDSIKKDPDYPIIEELKELKEDLMNASYQLEFNMDGDLDVTIGNETREFVSCETFNSQIQEISEQSIDNVKKINNNISSFDKNLIEVKQRLFDTDLKNRQYIFVGDSLREANGRWVFKKMVYKLAKCGISPCLIGKSGLKAEHFSRTNIVQALNDFPTTNDVIKVIKGTGSECVIDICLGINDLTKTEDEVVGYFKKAISDILNAKPDVKFILTTPNRYKNATTNNQKIYNIIKKVVDDLGNIAFSDVQNNVFRENEDITPYMIDDIHPNKLGQVKIGEFKIKELFDGSETVTHDIDFKTLTFKNTDGSETIIKYAMDYDNNNNTILYFRKDYLNKWIFCIVDGTSWVYSSELIGTNGLNVVMPRFNSNDCIYGIIEIENIEGLINYPSISQINLGNIKLDISNKINVPLIQSTSTFYDILDTIKFFDLNGRIDSTDEKAKSLSSVSFKVGFYKTEGEEPTEVFFKRVTENEYILNMSDNKAITQHIYIDKDGIYDLRAITWDTIRATGKLKIKGITKLKEVIAIGEQVKIVNAQHYSPIIEKSIIELLDY